MSALTQTSHIIFDSQGRPWIAGANTKVIEVILSHLAHGWDAEELHGNYPHLSLGQLHAALGYYYDNKEAMDQAIEDEQQLVKEFFQNQEESPTLANLRSLKRTRQASTAHP